MRPSDDLDTEALELAAQLARYCAERGHAVSLAGTVSTEVAAELIGRAVGTLQNWRSAPGGGPLVFRRQAGRCVYRLHDVADFLLAGEE